MNRYRPWLLLAPFLIFDLLLVLAPLSTVVWQSLHIVSPDYEMLPGLTLANYKRALDPAYLPALSRSFLYAGTSTFLALLLLNLLIHPDFRIFRFVALDHVLLNQFFQ